MNTFGDKPSSDNYDKNREKAKEEYGPVKENETF